MSFAFSGGSSLSMSRLRNALKSIGRLVRGRHFLLQRQLANLRRSSARSPSTRLTAASRSFLLRLRRHRHRVDLHPRICRGASGLAAADLAGQLAGRCRAGRCCGLVALGLAGCEHGCEHEKLRHGEVVSRGLEMDPCRAPVRVRLFEARHGTVAFEHTLDDPAKRARALAVDDADRRQTPPLAPRVRYSSTTSAHSLRQERVEVELVGQLGRDDLVVVGASSSTSA